MQFQLRAILEITAFAAVLTSIIALGSRMEGGVFAVPYHLIGKDAFRPVAIAAILVSIDLGIISYVAVAMYRPRTLSTVALCVAVPLSFVLIPLCMLIGLLNLYAAVLTVQFLAPALFTLALFSILESWWRKLYRQLPICMLNVCVAIGYWMATILLVLAI